MYYMSDPCKVAGCPALKVVKSRQGFCQIHWMVASDPALFEQAKKGQINALLKTFAEDVGRGLYQLEFSQDH